MSIWNKEEIKTKKEKLDKNIEVDTIIIGAGMTGMNIAYFLKDENICVVDASIVGHGVTLNTTAKITYFQECIYTKIANMTSIYDAIDYLNSQRTAIYYLKKIIKEEKIDCDFDKVSSYVFASSKKEVSKLEEEVEFLRNNGIDVIEKGLPTKIKNYKSYCVNDTYIFNPIKYLNGLYDILTKKGIHIYENTKIVKIEKMDDYYLCSGCEHNIKAKKVIFACHYPYFICPFLLPFKSSIEKSYIIVSKTNKYNKFTCINTTYPTYSMRYYNDGENIYQISLGSSHDTSVKQNDKDNFDNVQKMFKLKDKDIVMRYSNTDIMTTDHIPYIGKLKDNMFIAVGYNTWGMTNSVLAGYIIYDILQTRKNQYIETFSPKRFNVSNIVKFPMILFNQTKSFLGPKINKNKPWYPDDVKFFHKNGKSLASYKGHTIHNKCPHMGCSLIFNEKELTWDCPCHSSRFDIEGRCIKGPSNYDISYKE